MSLEIRYTLVPRDYWEFYKFAVLNIMAFKFNTISHCLTLLLASFSVCWLWAYQTANVNTVMLLGYPSLLSAMLLFVYFWQLKQRYEHLVAKTPGLVGEHQVNINADGFYEINPDRETFTTWAGVERIVETQNYIFVLFRSRWAYLVPKRAFEYQADAKTFLETAIAYWQPTVRIMD